MWLIILVKLTKKTKLNTKRKNQRKKKKRRRKSPGNLVEDPEYFGLDRVARPWVLIGSRDQT